MSSKFRAFGGESKKRAINRHVFLTRWSLRANYRCSQSVGFTRVWKLICSYITLCSEGYMAAADLEISEHWSSLVVWVLEKAFVFSKDQEVVQSLASQCSTLQCCNIVCSFWFEHVDKMDAQCVDPGATAIDLVAQKLPKKKKVAHDTEALCDGRRWNKSRSSFCWSTKWIKAQKSLYACTLFTLYNNQQLIF